MLMKVKCSSRGRRLPNAVPFAFYIRKLTHAADVDSKVGPYAHKPVFHTVTCTGLSTPHLRSTLPISCFWPRDAFPPSHAAQLMVEHFLAVANFLLPQSTSSSRSLLALHTLMPRLLSSSASSQPDLSRVQHSKGKGKAVLGDDHGSFERSDWLHIAHRKSS